MGIVVPCACAPSVGWFRLVRQGAVVDLGENFLKRSCRNRYWIATDQGPMALTVPVENANHPGRAMRDVRIDYSRDWVHRHLGALVAAYRGAPYFEHYFPGVEALCAARHERLLDFNRGLIEWIGTAFRIDPPVFSESYIAHADTDLRPRHAEFPPAREYIQVFADRQPFFAGASALDLLFNEGPGGAAWIVDRG